MMLKPDDLCTKETLRRRRKAGIFVPMPPTQGETLSKLDSHAKPSDFREGFFPEATLGNYLKKAVEKRSAKKRTLNDSTNDSDSTN